MNRLNFSFKPMPMVLLLASIGLSSTVSFAEEILPANTQSDEQISLWVNNAPLSLFIAELAYITGRKASIEGEIEGQVSGRFDGSMEETLNSLGEKYPVLFDLDDTMLAMAPLGALNTASISLGDVALADAVKSTLLAGVLQGNSVQLLDGEIRVSGHPEFVRRLTAEVALQMTDAGEPDDTVNLLGEVANVPESNSIALDSPSVAGDGLPSEPAATVEDVAASEIINAVSDESAADSFTSATSSESADESSARRYRWVTDIPGFETF